MLDMSGRGLFASPAARLGPATLGLFGAVVAAAYSLLPIASGLNVQLSFVDIAYAAAFWGLIGVVVGAIARRFAPAWLDEHVELSWALATAAWALFEAGYTTVVVFKPTRWPPLLYSAIAIAVPGAIATALSLRALGAAKRGSKTSWPPALVVMLSWTALAAWLMWVPRWLRPFVDSPDIRWLLWGGFDLAWIAVGVAAVVVAGAAAMATRWRVPTAAAAAALAGFQLLPSALDPGAGGPARVSDRPPVVWIMFDSVRADHTSAYGYSRPTTPNLERLGAQGTLVESHVSSGARTENTYAKMLSLTSSLDGYEKAKPLPMSGARRFVPASWMPRQGGLVSSMHDAGYETALFHVYYDLLEDRGLQPWMQAFDHVLRTRLSGDASLGPYLLRMVLGGSLDGIPRMDRWAQHRRRFLALDVVDRVQQFLDQRRGDRPLFMVIHLAGGHFPYYAFDPSQRLMVDRPSGMAAQYDDALRAADEQIAVVTRAVAARLPTATTFIFADHGMPIKGEPNLPNHVNVPLLVLPALPAAPADVTSSLDIVATSWAIARGGPLPCDGGLARDLRCPAATESRVVDHTGHGRFVLAAKIDGTLVAADFKGRDVVVGAGREVPVSACDFFTRTSMSSRDLAISPLEGREGFEAGLRAQLTRCNLVATP